MRTESATDDAGAEAGADAGTAPGERDIDTEPTTGERGAGAAADGAAEPSATTDNGLPPEEDPLPWLSDDGILLGFAAAACLLAATTAHLGGQWRPIVVLAAVAGAAAAVAFVVDLLTERVPDARIHLVVGIAALLGAVAAVPDRNLVNGGTLAAAAALVCWRAFDLEIRGASQ